MTNLRIGFGFDVHPLAAGYPMYVGGIKLESPIGAVGHSDADVLLHAICDALLGAANMRDIGHHFPNTDMSLKGISSLVLLQKTMAIIRAAGFEAVNIDSTIALEAPKINPHITAMQAIISEYSGIPAENISVKATTNEKLGYVGREEGVNAYAVAMVEKV